MKTLFILIIVIPAFVLISCHKQDDINGSQEENYKKAAVSDGGTKITFPDGSPGMNLIKTTTAKRGTSTVSVIAPARVVATISNAVSSKDRIVIFESPDITSLYSQYRQCKVNVDRTQKNLDRIRDMYDNHAATSKDVTDAETDAATSRTSMAEMEGRLRTMGYNPLDLDNIHNKTAWLISDVTESQIKDVEKGESVDISFASFPDKKYTGRATAVGDVVDPNTRTIKVRVTLPDPAGKFIPGMFARIDFGDPIKNIIVLPLSAVVTVDGKDYVFVETTPGTYERRRVTVNNSSSNEAVVLNGVSDGEKIVTEGSMLIKGLSFGF